MRFLGMVVLLVLFICGAKLQISPNDRLGFYSHEGSNRFFAGEGSCKTRLADFANDLRDKGSNWPGITRTSWLDL
jgi:hypothetical protein